MPVPVLIPAAMVVRLISSIRSARLARAVLACLCLAAASAWAAGEASPGTPAQDLPKPSPKVYRYLSTDGTTSFSDRPPAHDRYVVMHYGCFACNPQSPINWKVTRLYWDAYASEIEQAARLYNVDPALVRAVIHAESGFNVNARSPKGAIGLMQLMPATARELGVANPRLPRENIHGGARYLAAMLVRFKSDITLATAAYNAGPNAVQKHAGVPPYAETQVYVQRVRILHQRYKDKPQG